jgi:spore protease
LNLNSFFKSLGINLDLALEATEALRGDIQKEIPGVSEEKEEHTYATVTTIKILNKNGSHIMGRPEGSYVTIESPELKVNDKEIYQEISTIVANKIADLIAELKLTTEASVLLVGLGNRNATPDALGPEVVENSLVTRHLFHYAPSELSEGLREVSAIAPGVLGITGIETAEIIKGVVEKLSPDLVIAIDALAASNLERVGTTIQLTNTGINPGSGIGNNRIGINIETMGVPVIAIGVPTVVHAAVIAFEIFGALTQNNPYLTQQISEKKMQGIVGQILKPFGGQLVVTPKEIDELILQTAKVIATGINQGLHPGIETNDSSFYLQ